MLATISYGKASFTKISAKDTVQAINLKQIKLKINDRF